MNKRLLITSTDLMMVQFLIPHVKNLAQKGFEVEIACSDVGGRMDEVCEKLKEIGVNESTVVTHIPCYTYREAWAAALLPGVNPYSVPAGDGNQVGVWSPGYEDSFGVSYDGEIASPDWDNGFFDAMLEHGSTKTMICGHDHMNCFSVNYRGIRLTYSLKTGPGCSWNPLNSGGTVVEIDADGRASVRHHYVDVR